MNGEIYSIYHLSIEPSKFSAFQELIAKIVAATREEQDTLTYEYVVNDDHSAVHIIERYRAAGLLPHVEKTFAPFADTFLSLCKIEKLFVYGEPTAAMRAKLDGFGAVYLRPFDGFTR
jgi:quinol monooxygenase YgiN